MLHLNVFTPYPINHGYSEIGDTLRAPVNLAKQVHGNDFFLLDKQGQLPQPLPAVDALITAQANVCIGVQTADCVPILVAACSETNQILAIAAIHAGWRGTVAKISENVLEALRTQYRPHRFIVGIGPSISREKYEVDQDVMEQFPLQSQEPTHFAHDKPKFLLDVAAENRRQMEVFCRTHNLALILEQSNACTFSDAAHFPSYRRQGKGCGRIVSYIAIKR